MKNVVEQIRDDRWDQRVPDDMSRQPGTTLRHIINCHFYDDAWVPDVLAVRAFEDLHRIVHLSHGDFPPREYL